MPRNSRRSRTLRRVHVKLKKSTKLVYAKRRPSKAHCANCGSLLHGTPTNRTSAINKMSKTERRPERPYGGMLCSRCTRIKIKSAI